MGSSRREPVSDLQMTDWGTRSLAARSRWSRVDSTRNPNFFRCFAPYYSLMSLHSTTATTSSAHRRPIYRIYVDEVGNADLGSSDDPNHRFLSLTGICVNLEYVRTTLAPEMERLKSAHFESHPDEPVVLHRKEMLSGEPPFASLKNPAVREQFNAELLAAFERWEYGIITVCLDKRKFLETYGPWAKDPYHHGMATLLEHYTRFLEGKNATGDVMAESRGSKEDLRLKEAFSGLWETGTDYIQASRFQERLTSRQLKVKSKSANIAGLQLADLLAHPSWVHLLLTHGLREKLPPPFGAQVIGILKGKFLDEVTEVLRP